ncbi:MAG: protein kinase [Chloroflexi bacterium]|nr:protein kinase [Chloroflexota bacterium]
MPEPPKLQHLGKYEILEEVGRGGFGVVYKARNTTLNRIEALKVLKSSLLEDPAFVERFQQEAQSAANLKHPNIVTIYQSGEEQGSYFIAMEFLWGKPLDKVIAPEKCLPLERVAKITTQLASALDQAHAEGLVHRDIKPSNIIVDDRDHATLTDFGLAKVLSHSVTTISGQILGTPEYMAPEQAQGQPADARTDVYALGIVAFEMLTGRAPFKADTSLAVLYKQVNEPPPSLRSLRGDLPEAVESVVNKALAKNPEERYQTAGAMSSALQGIIDQAKEQDAVKQRQERERQAAEKKARAEALRREEERKAREEQERIAIKLAEEKAKREEAERRAREAERLAAEESAKRESERQALEQAAERERRRAWVIGVAAFLIVACLAVAGSIAVRSLFASESASVNMTKGQPTILPQASIIPSVAATAVLAVSPQASVPTAVVAIVPSTVTALPTGAVKTPSSTLSPAAPTSTRTGAILTATPTMGAPTNTPAPTKMPTVAIRYPAVALREPKNEQLVQGESATFEWTDPAMQQSGDHLELRIRRAASSIWEKGFPVAGGKFILSIRDVFDYGDYVWSVMAVDAEQQIVSQPGEEREISWQPKQQSGSGPAQPQPPFVK